MRPGTTNRVTGFLQRLQQKENRTTDSRPHPSLPPLRDGGRQFVQLGSGRPQDGVVAIEQMDKAVVVGGGLDELGHLVDVHLLKQGGGFS